jgi:hypothetical protein
MALLLWVKLFSVPAEAFSGGVAGTKADLTE